MGCRKLTYRETLSPLKVVYNDLIINENCYVGNYRYGFNGMERDDNVKGAGNSYTTRFRQYDPRVGRWLSIDPKANPLESPYVGMGNNPMVYLDPLGDTVVNNLFENVSRKALKIFMDTKSGLDYIGKFAAKGQKIMGHTFNKDGENHKKGFDLYLTDKIISSNIQGETENGTEKTAQSYGPSGLLGNGRFRLNVNINSNPIDLGLFHGGQDLSDAKQDFGTNSNEYRQASNIFLAGKISTLTHELFVHVQSSVIDFSDDGLINKSHQGYMEDHLYFGNSYGKDVIMYSTNGSYRPVIININHANLYLYEGWYINKVVHKWLKTGLSDKEISKIHWNGLQKK